MKENIEAFLRELVDLMNKHQVRLQQGEGSDPDHLTAISDKDFENLPSINFKVIRRFREPPFDTCGTGDLGRRRPTYGVHWYDTVIKTGVIKND